MERVSSRVYWGDLHLFSVLYDYQGHAVSLPGGASGECWRTSLQIGLY